MKKLKVAIIGFGVIGHLHKKCLTELSDYELTAICDLDVEKLEEVKNDYKTYTSYEEMIAKEELDVVTIATPHWVHPQIAIYAIKAGKNVLVEKPIGVHKAHVQELLQVIAEHPEVKVSAMFNQRTIPAHKKIKEMIENGSLGKINRINWVITNWFRSQTYYDSGDWRASWRGEGGGVLTNQCPHQLDLMQYFFGLPKKVTAFIGIGKYHTIEVEDEVTAYLEYEDGVTGVFTTSTGEAPGINRLEILAENGRLTLDNGKLIFIKNEIPLSEFCRTSENNFAVPSVWNCEIPVNADNPNQHRDILANLADAILRDKKLFAPAEEGVRGLELGNAMLLSGFKHETITLPIDEVALTSLYTDLVASSKYEKKVVKKANVSEDLSTSF